MVVLGRDEVEADFGAALVPTDTGVVIDEVVLAHGGVGDNVVARDVFENFARRNLLAGELLGAVEPGIAFAASAAAAVIAAEFAVTACGAAGPFVAEFFLEAAAILRTAIAGLKFVSFALPVAAVLQCRTTAAIINALGRADVVPTDVATPVVEFTHALFAGTAAAAGAVESGAAQSFRKGSLRNRQQRYHRHCCQNNKSLHLSPPYLFNCRIRLVDRVPLASGPENARMIPKNRARASGNWLGMLESRGAGPTTVRFGAGLPPRQGWRGGREAGQPGPGCPRRRYSLWTHRCR